MGKLGGKYATLSEKRQERSNTVFCSSWTPHNQMKSLNTKKLKNNIARKINKLRFLDVDTYHRLTEAPNFFQIIQIMPIWNGKEWQIVAMAIVIFFGLLCPLSMKVLTFSQQCHVCPSSNQFDHPPFQDCEIFSGGMGVWDWEKILMWGNSPFFSRFWKLFLQYLLKYV